MNGTATATVFGSVDVGAAHPDRLSLLLADAFDRSPIAMVVFSATGIVEHVNTAMTRLVGVSAASLVGRTANSLVHPDDTDMIVSFAELAPDRDPVAVDHRIIRADGEVRWIRSHVVAVGPAGRHSFFVQSIDNTAARRRDVQLRSIDTVTGLLSRDGLMTTFDDLAVAQGSRGIAPYTLFAVDIDDFRGLNDRLGAFAADRTLCLVGAGIRSALPVGAFIARVRDDVFVALVPGMDSRAADVLVERLLDRLATLSSGIGLPVLGYKVGAVAVHTRFGDPVEAVQLVEQRAQDPVITSDGVVVAEITSASSAFGTAATEPAEMSEWVVAIEAAIEAGDYLGVGEPLRVIRAGLEPLQRFELFVKLVLHQHKWVPLAKFAPYATRLGRADEVDRWMVGYAVALLRSDPTLELEVNVTRATIDDPSFVDHLAEMLGPGDPVAGHLLLGVTERDVAADVRRALAFSEAVRGFGATICLDDHGSVADGVRYLSLIEAGRVKLTGQYVRGAKHNSSDRAMVGILAKAAGELGIEVAAPFVTDEAMCAMLADLGVDLAQGRWIGHATRLRLPS